MNVLINSLPIKYPQLLRDRNKSSLNRRDKPHSKSVHKKLIKQVTHQKNYRKNKYTFPFC